MSQWTARTPDLGRSHGAEGLPGSGIRGGVWAGDPQRALRVARRLRTGSIAINGSYPPFPLVPFGGFRESGLGRELGPEGLRNVLEPHSIGLPAALRSAPTQQAVPPASTAR